MTCCGWSSRHCNGPDSKGSSRHGSRRRRAAPRGPEPPRSRDRTKSQAATRSEARRPSVASAPANARVDLPAHVTSRSSWSAPPVWCLRARRRVSGRCRGPAHMRSWRRGSPLTAWSTGPMRCSRPSLSGSRRRSTAAPSSRLLRPRRRPGARAGEPAGAGPPPDIPLAALVRVGHEAAIYALPLARRRCRSRSRG